MRITPPAPSVPYSTAAAGKDLDARDLANVGVIEP
jgi:hypothetical protein